MKSVRATLGRLLMGAIIAFTVVDARAILTKEQALKIMQSNGVRWQQTHLVVEDAKNLSVLADAALKPHAQIVGKELMSKADLSRFGIQSSGPDNIITYGAVVVEFDVPLLDKKSYSRSEAASAAIGISEEQSAQYQSDLKAGMVLTYLSAQRFAEKIRVLKANIDRDGEIVKMAQAKVHSGTGIELDLLRAKGYVAFEQMKLLDAETSYKKSVQDLATLLGQPAVSDELELLTLRSISIDADDPFAKTGIDDRADVKMSLQTVQAARLVQKQAQNEWFPTVSAFGEAGVGASSVFANSGPNAVGVIGLQIKAPLFDGGYLTGKEHQAQTDISKAELQARHVRLEADGQIKEALEQLKTSKAAAILAVEQVDLATKELEIAERRFETGAASGPDLATSQASLSNAKINQIDIIAGYEASKLSYFKSIGDLDGYFESEKNDFKTDGAGSHSWTKK
jgi:outer membrane protein